MRPWPESQIERVRICANKVVAGVRVSRLQRTIRPQDTRQFRSAQQIIQLEGLAVATPEGSSPLLGSKPY